MADENKKKTASRPKRGLGKGLNVLFGETGYEPEQQASEQKEMPETTDKSETTVKISSIIANEKQPRKNFDEEELLQLTESIKQYGVLQPLLVKKDGENYRIIAGERRYRAAKEAGLKEIPVVVRDYTSQQAAEISIIENVQRADLNPMEEAMAYQTLIDEYGLRQEDIADRVSKNRTTITNALRLLKLNDEVQKMLAEGLITEGHAKVLLSLSDGEGQLELANRIMDEGLSVRETEKIVRALQNKKAPKEEKELSNQSLYHEYEEKLRNRIGTKVRIQRKAEDKGRIEIDYYSDMDLQKILDLIGI